MDMLTLYLSANYTHLVLNRGGDVVERCAVDVPKAEVQAKRDALRAVEARCYWSKVGREFLDRVLEVQA